MNYYEVNIGGEDFVCFSGSTDDLMQGIKDHPSINGEVNTFSNSGGPYKALIIPKNAIVGTLKVV